MPSPVRVRPYALIRELANLGHQVTLACLVHPAWEHRFLSEITPYCHTVHPVYLDRFAPYLNCLASLPTGTPLSVAYCRSPQGRRLVRQLLASDPYDLVHTEFARALTLTAGLDRHPRVYDAVDSMTLTYRRSLTAAHVPWNRKAVALLEWLKMRHFERRALRQFDRVLVSSPADQETLQQDGTEVTALPNGVDADYFAFHEGRRQEATIVFLGRMSYYVNVASVLWFYKQVFPLIRRHRPDVRLQVVGRDPVPKIAALAADPAVEVTGTVSDVRPYLAGATLSICPMVTGAGIQNKMLEAMAIGTATVATSIASQALQAEKGEHLLVADDPAAFAGAVLRLLEDPPLRRRLAENARRYVESRHDWSRIGRQLEGIYFELVR